MAYPKSPPYLQLLKPPTPIPDIPLGTQLELPLQSRRLFIVDMSVATRRSFVTLLMEDRPAILFDIRPSPSFRLDCFSRKAAFQYFEKYDVNYFDLGCMCEADPRLDANLTSGRVGERIAEIISQHRIEPEKIGILLENAQAQIWIGLKLHETILPRPSGGWKIECVPRPRVSAVR